MMIMDGAPRPICRSFRSFSLPAHNESMNRRADLHTYSSISYGPAKLAKAGTLAGTDVEHDAVRQVGYIRQALSQNKRPTGFFIGAGCPLSIRNPDGSPLIPDVAGLTQSINDEFAKSANKGDWLKLLAAVTDGLLVPVRLAGLARRIVDQ